VSGLEPLPAIVGQGGAKQGLGMRAALEGDERIVAQGGREGKAADRVALVEDLDRF
jgi:hypothetical protein